MPPHRSGTAALVLGVAAWAQLALVPAAVSGGDVLSILAAVLALCVLGVAVYDSARSPPRAAALALAAFPAALGVAAFFAGRHAVPRVDALSRVVAAGTAVSYLAAVVVWFRAHRVVVPVVNAVADERPRPPAPAWRTSSLVALVTVAVAVAVLAPARLGAREPVTVAERVAGDTLIRGRGALVTAVGTLIALALVLQGGSSLLRASPARPRAGSRAAVYVVWALCAFLMRHWLDRAR